MTTVENLTCNDVKLISLISHKDDRGFFVEIYKKDWNINFDNNFIIDGVSFNRKKGTLRGMHAQNLKNPQSKLVTVTKGKILDIIVDARINSSTFGKYDCVELSSKNPKLLYVPVGFYHGYITLENNTLVNYKLNNYHDPNNEIGFCFDDIELNLPWNTTITCISNKDKNHVNWKNCYKFKN